ncbi:class I SAM-dependent methyltransferase [Oscillatoria acuminata]|uniref:Methylase involved in ubiquinone/menaquinone biosynthesis n=1 Tax=Oscillatoria acuminata PCC 6304 TaxID=56110 RepID=K9TDG4_9CYAN|nr:methyltransferase domain-containing protein [Oscillatoria acuminata]AFY80049.1 methylase involved in ubiquinone/menaquinone biosynthesis [Oscillatoria acuminata PCC 6304]
MDNNNLEIVEKIRQQFDRGPYPRIPLEDSPKEDYNFLYIHNIVTPFYLKNRKIFPGEKKVILDAGCGSGYKALALAEANPGSKIVGVDISEVSVNLAQKRLEYHGVENAEFHVLDIENLESLGLEFDYINADDVLYLIPDLVAGLQSMKAVLKPEGIIRGNLHSALQRSNYFRAQNLFRMMGLMDENPGELEIEIVRDTMIAIKDDVWLKKTTWTNEKSEDEEFFLANYLLQGDKGYTIPEMFEALHQANLEFISMVNWRQWELLSLFKEPNNLPAFLSMSLPEISIQERLHLFELLHPIHRLLDFWCGHPTVEQNPVSVSDWSDSDWRRAKVHLHPQIKTNPVKEDLIQSITYQRPFQINRHLSSHTSDPLMLGSSIATCLLPLWEGTQTVSSLVERWLQVRSIDPVTLEAVSEKRAFEEVKDLLMTLELFIYVLLQQSA